VEWPVSMGRFDGPVGGQTGVGHPQADDATRRVHAPQVPPAAHYASLAYDPPPPERHGCVSYDGRLINASGCNQALRPSTNQIT
jgi:hypothetical protein